MASTRTSFRQTKGAAEKSAQELSKLGQTWIVVYRPRTRSFDEYSLSSVNASPFTERTQLVSVWQNGGPESSLGVYRRDEYGWSALAGLDGKLRRVRKSEDVGAALAYFGQENRGKRVVLSVSQPLPAGRDVVRRGSRAPGRDNGREAKRYSGELTIDVAATNVSGLYRAIVRHGDRVLWFGNIRASARDHTPITGSSPAALDAAAGSALSHAEDHSPDVAPLSEEDDGGFYKVRRRPPSRRDPRHARHSRTSTRSRRR